MTPHPRRYSAGARWYDQLSGERFVYSAGRAAGLRLLRPRSGDVVVDLGCGTGLNFAPLVRAVGRTGMVIGIDRSPDMLAMAARRVTRHGWTTVRLVQADAVALDPGIVRALARDARRDRADAAIATYALSLLDDRDEAWRRLLACLRADARVAVVDMQPPTGGWRVLAPLARLACLAGGADIRAHPWRLLERSAVGPVEHVEVRGGHIVAEAAAVTGDSTTQSASTTDTASDGSATSTAAPSSTP